MKTSCASNPGAVKFGNFLNYYDFNSPYERLSKIKNTPDDIWKTHETPYLVLDVGCNSGDLTFEIYKFLESKINGPVCILGIDIDKNLILRAENTKHKFGYNKLIFKALNVMDSKDFNPVTEFLNKYNREKFDAVFCLSITMWIHLNHSDEGLKNFLQKTSTISNLFVLEPQPWKCYKNAVRRMKRSNCESFENYNSLNWKKNVELDIENYMLNHLQRKIRHVSETTKWNRRIFFYS